MGAHIWVTVVLSIAQKWTKCFINIAISHNRNSSISTIHYFMNALALSMNHKIHLKRLASLSHSNKHKISPSLTGPLTFLTMERPVEAPASASMNSTRTWVTFPVFPVRPRTRLTLASFTGWSCWIGRIVKWSVRNVYLWQNETMMQLNTGGVYMIHIKVTNSSDTEHT